MHTKEYGKMLKRNLIFEEGRLPAKNARGWKIEGQKRRVTWKENKQLREEFEVGGFMAQQGLWNIAKKRMLEDRGDPLEEDGNQLREYRATHEQILSSWLREDVEGEKAEMERLKEEAKQEESKSGRRGESGGRKEKS